MIETPAKSLAKLNKDMNAINRKLKNIHSNIKGIVNKTLVKEGNELRNIIITSMRESPKAAWFYKRRSVVHHPSQRGFPPSIDTGEGVRSIMYDVEDMKLEIGAIKGTAVSKGGRSYMEILETTKMRRLKRPWLEPRVKERKKEMLDRIRVAIRKEFKKP